MKKQKIGIDIRAIGKQRAGDEYYTLNLIKELLKLDRKNYYFLLTDTKNTKEIKDKILAGTKNKNVEIIPVLPRFKLFWTFFSLPRMAKKLDLDILHVQYIAPFWLSQKTKLITTIADVSFNVCPDLINKLDLFFLRILIPLSLKKADKIITVSEFTKKEIIKYYDIEPDKITAIHNGESSEIFFSEQNKNKKLILEKFGVKNSYLFYVGTHQPRKDLPTLIKAFISLKAEYSSQTEIKNLQLIIGGKIKSHNYDPQIDKTLKDLKKDPIKKELLKDLIFTGYLNDEELVTIHREAKFFVYPSLYEGFGLPLIEAMVSKTPVICSKIDCFKEIAGNAARFYKPKDPVSLQKAIFEVITNPQIQQDLIIKGLKNAERFSWKTTADKTLKVFLEK